MSFTGLYIGDIAPKKGEMVLNTYDNEILTVKGCHEYYGYLFKERGSIQGEFYYPIWLPWGKAPKRRKK